MTRATSVNSTQQEIVIRGAREHNLKDVDLRIPKNRLVVMTGVSGSGKSSLAFDTLYAEGQRRYVESLSSYARQFLGQLPKPEVDTITGLAPSISIQQKTSGRNPRSTVGTITEIYDYLRVLYARVGTGYCPQCGQPISAQSVDQIVERILALPSATRYQVLAPIVQQQKGEYRDLFADLLKRGYLRARVDGALVELKDDPRLDRQMRHDIDVVVDRLSAGKVHRNRVAEAVENALRLADGTLIVALASRSPADMPDAAVLEADVPLHVDAEPPGQTGRARHREYRFSSRYACADCGLGFDPPSPQLFSFNSPLGMCLECNGLGMRHDFALEKLIPDERLSLNKGAIALLGPLTRVGRWRKHLFHGALASIEKQFDLPAGSMAKTRWGELPEGARREFLFGTGRRNITFSWRYSGGIWKHGGTYDGYVNDLLENYRKTRSGMRRRQLEKYMEFAVCSACHGTRLNPQACHVRIASSDPDFRGAARSLPEFCQLSIADAARYVDTVELSTAQEVIAGEVLKEIRGRLGFLLQCGLDYLTLDRTAPTLSGGESQRIRLAGQIGCGLVGVVYILDEPSIGLHPRDNELLLESLKNLRDQGNTVIVVEHDEETMRAADHIVDFGPGPGVRGGEIVAEGTLEQVRTADRSVTGGYLSAKLAITPPAQRRKPGRRKLKIVGARHHNLQGIDVAIPLGTFTCVTGVSGSGKSSLVNDILWQVVNRDVNKGKGQPGTHTRVNGLKALDKAIDIDQSPIGRTPRSNPATYVKVFDLIRSLFTQLPESRMRGYKPGRFSFNVPGGRCEACEGYGASKLEMDFLADVWITCPVCEGRRFNHETLEVRYKGTNIAEVLDMDIAQALEHFENHPKIARLLRTLHDVGLDYLKLGQPSPTLSGGEAQRIKLARELGKRSTGQTLYLLDEPTTGLHFDDVKKLLEVLQSLVDAGNTVLVVEHNTDVLKCADWLIDLGPEGGVGGGRIVCEGTPEEVVACPESYTGRALAPALGLKPARALRQVRRGKTPAAVGQWRSSSELLRSDAAKAGANGRHHSQIVIRGAAQHNLQDLDLTVPRNRLNVFCGPSGSGKSSLAMDTLYAEGQRRYVESLSSYARQFLGQMPKPRVEHIHGLSPAIAIEQKTVGQTPRSTVGTVTEVYDYLRILYARLGTLYCPVCDIPIVTQTTDEVVDRLMTFEPGSRLLILAPQELDPNTSYDTLWGRLKSQGFVRVRVDGTIHRIEDAPQIDHRRHHEVEIVCDRITIDAGKRARIADSVEAALDLGRGVVRVAHCLEDTPESEWPVTPFSLHYACQQCGRSFDELTPHNFSFNSPLGWCEACEGLGVEQGTETSYLISHPDRSLAEGAVDAWPDLRTNPLFRSMIDAWAQRLGIPLDVPFRQLAPRQQRCILQGTGEQWFEAEVPGKGLLRFQYKGLYPAITEASRLSYSHRMGLRGLMGEVPCSVCQGSRLRDVAAAVRFQGLTLHQVCEFPLAEALALLQTVKLSKSERQVAGDLLQEATSRLSFLVHVGLNYLTLSRTLPTLSGGETQRIRLAGQIGRALTGVLYVLDEPTIGLHPRDNRRLLEALTQLRDLGNTLVLVEHDREVLQASDRLYDFGPGAGRLGGTVVAQGTPRQLARRKASLTGQFLSEKRCIAIPASRRVTESGQTPSGQWLELLGARMHNLRDVHLRVPLGSFTCVTGVSGSGKSSLIEGTLSRVVAQKLHRTSETPGSYDEVRGLEHVNKLIVVDQQPLGSTPASNPATYTGVFDSIRELFSHLPEAKVRGYRPGRFSFNRPGGRCDACEGNGQQCIEMHFLPDVWVECDVCHGKRYNQQTLAVKYRGYSIADVLEMPIGKARKLFENLPRIRTSLETLCAVGLDYLTLGQPAPTLSGGEAQRVKLAAELAKPSTGQTLYLLDEPTTGLHFDDIEKLLAVLNGLVDRGNTVVVIEHNLDVIKTADWVVDLGPEAGSDGGQIVVQGTPEQIVSSHGQSRRGQLRSWTAECLAPVMKAGTRSERATFDARAVSQRREGDVSLREIGRSAQMPWELDGRRWHTRERVSHTGAQCRWDGAALDLVVDALEDREWLASPDWSQRSVVEITGTGRSVGWFLHALTGDEWLLKLKFRIGRNTFREETLQERLPLPPLDDLDDLPVYGKAPRVSVKNLKGPWQEVVITVHWRREIETPEFFEFLQEAAESYRAQVQRMRQKPQDLTPWKVLGRKWHLSRKGFPSQRRVLWTPEVLRTLVERLETTARQAAVDWKGKQIVKFRNSDQTVIATLHTKRRAAVELTLFVKAGSTALGRVADFGAHREIRSARDGRDAVCLKFRTESQVADPGFRAFLDEFFAEALSTGNAVRSER